MPNNEITTEYDGYTIKLKRDFPPGSNQEGYVVTKDGSNVMPGATWFKTTEDAIKGISALNITNAITTEDDPKTFARIFWSLIRLTKPLEGSAGSAKAATEDSQAAASAKAAGGVYLRLTRGDDPPVLRGPYRYLQMYAGAITDAPVGRVGGETVAQLDYETDVWFTTSPDFEREDWDWVEIVAAEE